MDNNSGIAERKGMAMGKGPMESSDFGCKPMDHSKGAVMVPEADMTKGPVTDGERRGAAMPVKHTKNKYPSQSEVDHGPHMMRTKEMP